MKRLICSFCLLLLTAMLAACNVNDGVGNITAEVEIEGVSQTIIIRDGDNHNQITLYPQTDQIFCMGEIYHLRLDFVTTPAKLSTADLQLQSEVVCHLGQEGIDILTNYLPPNIDSSQ